MRVLPVLAVMRLTMEGLKDQTPGIERREQCSRDGADERIERHWIRADEGRLNDGVLGEIASRERKAGERQRADEHHDVCVWDAILQAAHVADVLLMMHRMDHRPR